jgi:hypothetical protein
MGKQFLDSVDQVLRDAREDITEPGERPLVFSMIYDNRPNIQ